MQNQGKPELAPTPGVALFRTVIVLSSHLRTRMDQRLAAIGLTTQQAAVLTVVESSEGPPTLGDVAAQLGSSHQNARQIVAALERKGLLEVVVDVKDRRVRRLSVTPAVEELFSGRNLADHQEVDLWLSALSADEQQLVVSLLERVLQDLMRH